MALSEVIKLRGKAKALGIAGYKAMSEKELTAAIAGSNGTASKTKSTKAVKTATKTAGKKTASAKSAPAKTAKRPTTGAKRGRPVGSKNKTTKTAVEKAPAKRGRPPGSGTKTAKVVKSNYHGGRNLIDNSTIDWTAEWTGAKSGVRAIIFKALKKNKGDKQKTFEMLLPDVTEIFPKNTRTGERYTKERRLALLRWNIGRVAFDFVIATGQHSVSKKFGTLGTGAGAKKPAKKAATKSAAKSGKAAPAKRRGRPPGSKNVKKSGRK
jgi:hypothetical protein